MFNSFIRELFGCKNNQNSHNFSMENFCFSKFIYKVSLQKSDEQHYIFYMKIARKKKKSY